MASLPPVSQTPLSPSGAVKGSPITLLTTQTTAKLSDTYVPCLDYNALHLTVLVTGQNASCDLTVLGAPQPYGVWLPLPDINAVQHITQSVEIDVIVGQSYATVRIDNVQGTFASGQGITVIATPYIAPGQSRVQATLVTNVLSNGANPIYVNSPLAFNPGNAPPATTGLIRLPNNQTIVGRNAANSGDVPIIGVDASNRVSLAGGQTTINSTGTLVTNGNLGVGVSPSYPADINGACHASSFPTSSDERLKRDVENLTDVLPRLERIHPVRFRWDREAGRRAGREYPEREEIGLIAQEVEREFPELVTVWRGADGQSYRAVDYGRMVAVLVRAIQELAHRIDGERP